MAEATADKPWSIFIRRQSRGKVDLAAYSNLADLIEEALTKHMRIVSPFIAAAQTSPIAELDQLSSAFAVHLTKQWISEGGSFRIDDANVLQYPIALMGCLRLGLTVD